MIETSNFQNFHFQNIMGKFCPILLSPNRRGYNVSQCLISVNMASNRFWDEICLPAYNYERQIFEKLHIKSVNSIKNVPLYQISVNLENIRFWNQICPKNMNQKNCEKININKIEISI